MRKELIESKPKRPFFEKKICWKGAIIKDGMKGKIDRNRKLE